MSDINRMDHPVIPQSLKEIDFSDLELTECPYIAHQMLRDEQPVWYDEITRSYIVTRYEDIRAILTDPATYSSVRNRDEENVDKGQAQRVRQIYETRGWVPAATLALRDEPNHKQMRAMYDEVFRPGRIKQMETLVEETAYRLIDDFIDDGRCEFQKQFSVPFPLIIIMKQTGAPEEDMWRIKQWTEAWTQRTGSQAKTEEKFQWCMDQEIEAQHYFHALFERLRTQPDDTFLSELVNRVIPEWGRPLNESELQATMFADTFVGGAETTTSSLGAGIMLLGKNPKTWAQLKSDPEKYLRNFVEEVLRLESPVQSRVRIATRDVDLHGVTIPKGAMIDLRLGAANRDERQFGCPVEMDLERKSPGNHMAFGQGVHHCLGAPLARRELYWGFKAFLDRIKDFHLTERKNNFRHIPHFFLRGLKELHIEFTKE